MKKRIFVFIIGIVVLISAVSGQAADKMTDNADLSSYIAGCEQFGLYRDIAEALLCAACIPYGESPERCVDQLRNKGFEFEFTISTELPYNVTPFDVIYSSDGTAKLPMIREVTVSFSPEITLYLRTETQMVSLKAANDVTGIQEGNIWMPAEDIAEGKIVGAHLQFFDEITQEWLTWTLMSPDNYKNA